jgi:hypothetical protein
MKKTAFLIIVFAVLTTEVTQGCQALRIAFVKPGFM